MYQRIVLVLLLILYGNPGVAQVEDAYSSVPIVKKSEIENFSMKPGKYSISFEQTNKRKWDVRVFIPEIEPGRKYPLVLALHWAGNQNTYKEYGECLAFPALDTLGAIIIVPSSDGLPWIVPENEIRVIDLVKKIKKYWPVDEDKILVTGYSNGGIGSWIYADKYPKLFCAAIAIAGRYEEKKFSIPIFVVHGEKDELFDVNEVGFVIEKTKANGSQIDFQILENFTHHMACSYIAALREKALIVKDQVFTEESKSDRKDK